VAGLISDEEGELGFAIDVVGSKSEKEEVTGLSVGVVVTELDIGISVFEKDAEVIALEAPRAVAELDEEEAMPSADVVLAVIAVIDWEGMVLGVEKEGSHHELEMKVLSSEVDVLDSSLELIAFSVDIEVLETEGE
jgi:hypothetical protein